MTFEERVAAVEKTLSELKAELYTPKPLLPYGTRVRGKWNNNTGTVVCRAAGDKTTVSVHFDGAQNIVYNSVDNLMVIT